MLYDSEVYSLEDRLQFIRLLRKYSTGLRSNVLRNRGQKEVEVSLIFTIDDKKYEKVVDLHAAKKEKDIAKGKPNVKNVGITVSRDDKGQPNISIPIWRPGYIPMGSQTVHTCEQNCDSCNGGCDL